MADSAQISTKNQIIPSSEYPVILGLKIRVRPYIPGESTDDRIPPSRMRPYEEHYYVSDQGYYCDIGWNLEGIHYGFKVQETLNDDAFLIVTIDGEVTNCFYIPAGRSPGFIRPGDVDKCFIFKPDPPSSDKLPQDEDKDRGIIQFLVGRRRDRYLQFDCIEEVLGGESQSAAGDTVYGDPTGQQFTSSDKKLEEFKFRRLGYLRLIAIPPSHAILDPRQCLSPPPLPKDALYNLL